MVCSVCLFIFLRSPSSIDTAIYLECKIIKKWWKIECNTVRYFCIMTFQIFYSINSELISIHKLFSKNPPGFQHEFLLLFAESESHKIHIYQGIGKRTLINNTAAPTTEGKLEQRNKHTTASVQSLRNLHSLAVNKNTNTVYAFLLYI